MDTILTNGVTYYKLEDIYSGDTTKHCSLKTEDMDQNFHALRGLDIESFALSGNSLVLRRLDGSEMKVELNESTSITTNNLTFNYNSESGNLEITYPDSATTVISGFTTAIYTDATLDGDGSPRNPLKFSKIERTGAYSPADEYIELEHGEVLPTEGVRAGHRVVTKELKNNLGKLYSKDGLNLIREALEESDSEWRIPSKQDWDKLLDSLEPENYVELGFLPHSSSTIDYLGKEAAQHLKSEDFMHNDNPIEEDSTCGYDTIGFNVMPVGVAVPNEYGHLINEGFLEKSVFWTSTPSGLSMYAKGFFYDTNKVPQTLEKDNFNSIRLVKDYTSDNYMGDEGILGQTYPTVLCDRANQVWTSVNVFATKNQIQQLIKGFNYTDVVVDGDTSDISDAFYINEFNGNEWIKKELKEGDSIVIIQRDIDSGITKYYRRWLVKDGELRSFEDYAEETFIRLETEFNNAIASARTDFENGITNAREEFNYRICETVNNFNNVISALSATLSTQITAIDNRLETFINDELEGTIKYTVKQYIQDTTNEIKITETNDGRLKIGFSDDAIFG